LPFQTMMTFRPTQTRGTLWMVASTTRCRANAEPITSVPVIWTSPRLWSYPPATM
jgi:hypothetical protein